MSDADRRRVSTPVDTNALIADVDLVAMNLRGAEWTLLSDPRFRESAARVVIVECHESGCPEADPVAAAGRFLAGAGYVSIVRRKGRGERRLLIGWRP